ncbi:MAG: bifunctional anthranilate synthase component I family protein/class IV aminotransferase [Clostridium sp.]|nr:bifunctional anthranilate synthase component I family protein/class IV aminotransferase [Clostridium sp.]
MQIYAEKLFKKPEKIITAFDEKQFKEALIELENETKNAYALGYIRYEAKDCFLGKKIKSKLPLLYFEIHKSFKKYKPSYHTEIPLNPRSDITFEQYKKALEEIKNEISNGNTYEVNYTFDRTVECSEDPLKLYESLLQKQKTPYNAFIKNEYETLLSFSPELFFELDRKTKFIKTKPMKGTVKRGLSPQEDKKNIEFLKSDIKNRAENVMIVDLLRNDLSKIAKTKTVKVEKLFEIETHKTLHQMTSEITAELNEDTNFFDIFEAIFPCGSITGAPKISTMALIDRIETGKRNIYCGAIGFISPQKAIFSVPIRILQKANSETAYKYRAGGAVVWDSDIKDEWEEADIKTGFLKPSNDFKIIETAKVENKKILYLEQHLSRMKASAKFFDFKFNEDLYKLKFEQDGMLRILLNKDGSFETQLHPLKQTENNLIKISDTKVNSKNTLLCHKTTCRPWYEESLKKIKNNEIYDEIFFNEKDELTEGSRTNIVVETQDGLFTPSLKCGLLNGILRQKLIDEGKVKEKILFKEDLMNAKKIFCINSVRGVKEVTIKEVKQ